MAPRAIIRDLLNHMLSAITAHQACSQTFNGALQGHSSAMDWINAYYQ
jgi:hypothetical protein